MFYVFGQKSLKKITMVSIAGGAAFYLLFIKGLNLPI
jgi:branched-subunit amino acid transport protein AzlD